MCNPKKSKPIKSRIKNNWVKWLFPITGLIATIWFLIRVIPKPSRATYPCQRVTFPLASSFVAHILGICATAIAFRKARQRLHQSRYVLAGVCILIALTSAWFTISINSKQADAAPFVPPDPPNSPMGVAKGIYPGRVVWVHDPNATDWDGSTGYYWDDDHTDQEAVEQMLSKSLRWLTGEPNDEAAWDALFRHFNQTHGKGDVGYQSGEKIVIKPNNNEQRSHNDVDNNADMSPHLVLALLKQLVYKAGVEQNCITLCDPTRFIADKTYNKCNNVFTDVVYEDTCYTSGGGTEGRVKVVPSDSNLIYYSGFTTVPNNRDRLATSFINAAYLINLAGLKGHINAGVTLCGKNLYGAPCDDDPAGLHNSLPYLSSGLGAYRAIVDLMGHEHIGGKTFLYLIDGLWGSKLHKCTPEPWSMLPFNNDYTSSLFASQDPVAIDSVCLDFLRTQWRQEWESSCRNSIDDYLHEAALANDPCSGTFYDPENDGTQLASLGVHEHWNNAADKLYSRNFGIGEGIELVSAHTFTCTSPLGGDINGDCQVNFSDVDLLVRQWLETDTVEPNLAGYWKLDEGSGTTAYDLAGSNHGTIYGAEWTTRPADTVLSFDGYEDYVELDSIYADASTGMTWSVWFEYESDNTFVLDQREDGIGYQPIYIGKDDYEGDLQFYSSDTADNSYFDTNLQKAKWYHVVMVLNGTDVLCYLNGSFADSKSDTNHNFGTKDLHIGTRYNIVGCHKGVIEDVRIYNRALDANEIMQIYQALPRANLNEDCNIDFADFSILADDWLKCNLSLPSSCQ